MLFLSGVFQIRELSDIALVLTHPRPREARSHPCLLRMRGRRKTNLNRRERLSQLKSYFTSK